jgi:hypothetical protein
MANPGAVAGNCSHFADPNRMGSPSNLIPALTARPFQLKYQWDETSDCLKTTPALSA